MEIDGTDFDDMYNFMSQNMSGGGMQNQNLSHMLPQHGAMNEPSVNGVSGSMASGVNNGINQTDSMLHTNAEDAMMEDSIQELRRQSMAGFPMADYMNYNGLVDAQSPMDMGLPNLNTSSISMGNNFDNSMFVLPTPNSAGSGLMDIATYQDSYLQSIQNYGNSLSNSAISRHNLMMDSIGGGDSLSLQQQDSHDNMTPQSRIPSSQRPTQYNTMNIKMDNIYSSSGFDMIGVLMRVAARPNPKINIGAVDMSCAFVVCDARKFDMPIVYCSATFERLTGYTKHEILGRNCRFLQAPMGGVEPGSKRKYVDEESVRYLKEQCESKEEAQVSLINYRKGGQPFMNLLTTIPITWESDDIAFIVGFQVDLVDHPGSIMNKNHDGTIQINYQHPEPPTYYLQPPPEARQQQLAGMTISKVDVSRVLASLGSVDTDMARRLWDKILLENTDDVVHVLSLKGLFMYCSPSVQSVLEYEPQELVGTALSSVCHPSDIVPVTRDLKDTSSGSMVNIVFRIRRKYSGYVWFESHGSLHIEQGKGRKCIILVGRERPVYKLSWQDVLANGGMGENEMWTKIAISGMFLFVPTNFKLLLDREPDDLIGTSIQALMRPDSRMEVNKALDSARTGKKMTVRHELQNRRGQFLHAITTFFPDLEEGQKKPTFLLAQTKLVKHSRSSTTNSQKGTASEAGSVTPKQVTPSWSNASSASPLNRENTGDTVGTRSANPGQQTPIENENINDHAGDEHVFDELKTTRSSSWQFELRQMQRTNKRLQEEYANLLAMKKRRKRKKGADALEKDCANCHTKNTPEWRRGPSGRRDLCNSCGLRYAKLVGRDSPKNTQCSDSNFGDMTPRYAGNGDAASPRGNETKSRTNSGADDSGTGKDTGSSSEQTTPNDITNSLEKSVSPGALDPS